MLVRIQTPIRLFSKKENKFKVYYPGNHEIDDIDFNEDKKNPGFSKFFQALIDEEKIFILNKINLKSKQKKNEVEPVVK